MWGPKMKIHFTHWKEWYKCFIKAPLGEAVTGNLRTKEKYLKLDAESASVPYFWVSSVQNYLRRAQLQKCNFDRMPRQRSLKNLSPSPFLKYFFQWACRIILGPPKHVLHAFVFSTAIRTALKIARGAPILEKQACKARRCVSYLQIWNYHWLTHPLTDRGRC